MWPSSLCCHATNHVLIAACCVTLQELQAQQHTCLDDVAAQMTLLAEAWPVLTPQQCADAVMGAATAVQRLLPAAQQELQQELQGGQAAELQEASAVLVQQEGHQQEAQPQDMQGQQDQLLLLDVHLKGDPSFAAAQQPAQDALLQEAAVQPYSHPEMLLDSITSSSQLLGLKAVLAAVEQMSIAAGSPDDGATELASVAAAEGSPDAELCTSQPAAPAGAGSSDAVPSASSTATNPMSSSSRITYHILPELHELGPVALQQVEALVTAHPDIWAQLDLPSTRVPLLSWLRAAGRTADVSEAAALLADLATLCMVSNQSKTCGRRVRVQLLALGQEVGAFPRVDWEKALYQSIQHSKHERASGVLASLRYLNTIQSDVYPLDELLQQKLKEVGRQQGRQGRQQQQQQQQEVLKPWPVWPAVELAQAAAQDWVMFTDFKRFQAHMLKFCHVPMRQIIQLDRKEGEALPSATVAEASDRLLLCCFAA
jgi:hypothetical protein